MTLTVTNDNGLSLLIGDNTSESITLSPGQLTNFPGGLLALGGNDTVIGSADGELIFGNEGQDSISGGAGNDTLFGSKDNDQLDGGTGNDSIPANLGDDVIRSGDGNDTLLGGKGNDQLFGDAGDDFLSGDRDIDTLTGGQGSDTFALSTGSGLDIITDFENTIDYIQVPADVSVSDILIQAAGTNTLIILQSTGEQLVQLNNIQASNITIANLLLPNQSGLTEMPEGPGGIPQSVDPLNPMPGIPPEILSFVSPILII
ncbi:MAG: calcium-binding protein [Planktothrix rubescens PR222]